MKGVKEEKIERIHLIFVQNCEKVNITTSRNNEIASTHIDIADNRVQAMNLGGNNFWVMVTGDKDLEIQVNTESTKNSKTKIYKAIIESKGNYCQNKSP